MALSARKSEAARAFREDGALKTHVGGQALLEGIMMRGKLNWAVAVREPDGGIYTEEHDLSMGKDAKSKLNWPIVRGVRAFVGSLVLGYKALSIAAEHAYVEEDEEGAAKIAETAASVIGSQDEAEHADDVVEGLQPDASGREARQGSDAFHADDKGVKFSWVRDFGNPDEMIDGLAAQRTLEVIDGDTGLPVRFEDEVGETEDFDEIGADDVAGVADETDEIGVDDVAGVAGAADVTDEADADDAAKATDAESEKKPLLDSKAMAFSMVLGLVLGIALFIVVPAWVTNLIVGEYDSNTLAWNIVDGLLRIAVFIFYIWLIGRMKDIKRMFGYHGAEHKTIHCFEHGLDLTPENARSFPRLHVRCGTAFLIMVMILAIFIYTVTPLNALIDAWGVPAGAPKLILVIVVRIILLPVIAGVAYEVTVKWAGSHPNNPLVKVVLWPGMQMQRLTTREPDDGQIECAIAAMRLVLEREEAEGI